MAKFNSSLVIKTIFFAMDTLKLRLLVYTLYSCPFYDVIKKIINLAPSKYLAIMISKALIDIGF